MAKEEYVTLTIRVPEQFFEMAYPKASWDAAEAASEAQSKLAEGERLPREALYDLPEYLTDSWRSDIDIEEELYGPDGQQVPLW